MTETQLTLLLTGAAAAAASVPPPEAALPERPRGEGVTYVNIPVSPTSKKQLNYMELELQEPGAAAHAPPQRKACITSDESKVNGWCRARRTVRKCMEGSVLISQSEMLIMSQWEIFF